MSDRADFCTAVEESFAMFVVQTGGLVNALSGLKSVYIT